MRGSGWVVMAAAGALWAVPAQAQLKDRNGKSEVVCKRIQATGSLVAKKKECRTKVEWELEAQSARATGQYEMDRQRTLSGGQ